MKKLTFPKAIPFPVTQKCCGNLKSREFIFGSGDAGCCGELGAGFNFGSQVTEADFINWAGYTYTGTCPVTVRFVAQMTGWNDDPENFILINVQGADTVLAWIENEFYTDVVFQPGDEIQIFAQTNPLAPVPDTVFTLTATNVTCGTDLGEVLNWELSDTPCCGLQSVPFHHPEEKSAVDYDSSLEPYTVLGSCPADVIFNVTYDNILTDPFGYADIYVDGNPVGLAFDTPTPWTMNPGESVFFVAGITIGTGPGTITFTMINSTCGTPVETIFVVTLGV